MVASRECPDPQDLLVTLELLALPDPLDLEALLDPMDPSVRMVDLVPTELLVLLVLVDPTDTLDPLVPLDLPVFPDLLALLVADMTSPVDMMSTEPTSPP